MDLGPGDSRVVDTLEAHMQPLRTNESATLLKVVESDPEWVVVGDSFHGNFGSDEPLCPECASVWESIYIKFWEKGDFVICIDTFDCAHGHWWTRSTGPNRREAPDN